jgi:hypothetical protein
MNSECIRNITKGCNGYKYTKILKREQRVRYLERNTHQQTTTKKDQQELFTWIEVVRMAPEELQIIIKSMTTPQRLP